jgi:MFS family permease
MSTSEQATLARQPVGHDPTGRTSRPLGLPGQIAVVAGAALAIAVGLTSGVGLLESAPYAVVGGWLVIRRPRHLLGWLLLAGAWSFALSSVPVPATAAQLVAGGVPPLVMAVAVVQASTGGFLITVLFVITLVFPSGRFPTGPWGRLARLALAIVLLLAILGVFAPTISVSLPGISSGVNVPNPLALVPGWPLWPVVSAGPPLTLVLTAAGVMSMVVRLRRAQGVERAQLRWLVWSMAFIVVGFVIGLVGDSVFTNGLNGVVWLPAILAFSLPPLAIGIAVLRYRLYEIDRLVSRTLGYGLVTILLLAIFSGAILALQAPLSPLTGGNTLAVAGSTLLVAALFQPLQRQVQTLVDRRFNRARYDAQAAVQSFSARLRDEVDLEILQGSLLTIVEATLEPAASGLWLRRSGSER